MFQKILFKNTSNCFLRGEHNKHKTIWAAQIGLEGLQTEAAHEFGWVRKGSGLEKSWVRDEYEQNLLDETPKDLTKIDMYVFGA